MGLLRLVHILGDNNQPEDFSEPWLFSLFTSFPRLHAALIVGVLYPFLLIWVVVGTVWFVEVQLYGENCFLEPQQGWYFLVWLLIFYIWVIVYTLAITVSAMTWVLSIQYRNSEVMTIYNHLSDLYGESHAPSIRVALLEGEGLSLEGISRLHEFYVEETHCDTTCSICLEELSTGDHVRSLPCSHLFHRHCVDLWLLRRAECPMCKLHLHESF